MLTSKFLNIKSPLLQVVDDFVGVNVFYQNKKITNKELKRIEGIKPYQQFSLFLS